jgi:hypothetical protein
MLNRFAHIVFSLILVFTVGLSACTDKTDTPVVCTTPGCLEVLVCDETQTNYFAAAEVFIYNTAAERDADVARTNQLEKGLTNSSTPKTDGAFFFQKPSQRFYFFARWTNGGTTNFSGTGDALVTTCDTAIVSCKVK